MQNLENQPSGRVSLERTVRTVSDNNEGPAENTMRRQTVVVGGNRGTGALVSGSGQSRWRLDNARGRTTGVGCPEFCGARRTAAQLIQWPPWSFCWFYRPPPHIAYTSLYSSLRNFDTATCVWTAGLLFFTRGTSIVVLVLFGLLSGNPATLCGSFSGY